MKIQHVAERTGLSIHTLRYYEQAGLLAPVERRSNGHRDYTEDDVYRIVFVTRLRASGMPIADIKRYVEFAVQGDATLVERLKLLEDHRNSIEQRITELRQHHESISGKIAHYRSLYEQQLRSTLQENNAEGVPIGAGR